ncbi:MAG: alpha/beta hydrolase [Verrucomicrobiae bacterium]|nr:alpha/beta hydrolase [Verrucomicrobiae bacterium]
MLRRNLPTASIALLSMILLTAGAGFRRLGKDLKFTRNHGILAVQVTNADDYPGKVWGIVLDLDPNSGQIVSADATLAPPLGMFGFYVEDGQNHLVGAFADLNDNQQYEKGEPAWFHSDAEGNPTPLPIDPATGKGRTSGTLSKDTVIPVRLTSAVKEYRNGRAIDEIITGQGIKIALGDLADLNDPKFSAVRGQEGLWEPASFPVSSGIGIYFLEPYDPGRVPVLFVYGMSGSPQDWQPFFKSLDRKRYQPWFYYYPTGRRLDEAADALNNGVKALHAKYRFDQLDVVAHSMGGLVSRSFITKNVLRDGNPYITKFVTISTPWGGHEAAAMGVKRSPKVVPSWYDMQNGSDFQRDLFEKRLRCKVDHYLLFGYGGEKSMILPSSNDGTVSVASQLWPDVQNDVVQVAGFNSDHVGILSNPAVLDLVERILDQEESPASIPPGSKEKSKGLFSGFR